MRYPGFNLALGRTALANHRQGKASGRSVITPVYKDVETDFTEAELEQALQEINYEISPRAANLLHDGTGAGRDKVEGELSSILYTLFEPFPAQIIGDPDFWRYVSVEVVRDFVHWRDGADCKEESFGLQSTKRVPICVPVRMFNRALICRDASEDSELSPSSLASSGGSDFWKSHVFRVVNQYDPRIVRFLLEAQGRSEAPIPVMRKAATTIRQLRANLVLEMQSSAALEVELKQAMVSAAEQVKSEDENE